MLLQTVVQRVGDTHQNTSTPGYPVRSRRSGPISLIAYGTARRADERRRRAGRRRARRMDQRPASGSPPVGRVPSRQESTIATSDYSARHLSVLEGLEAVRKRPGMYIGSTDSRGLMHCLWEIIDNSVDEALGGHGDAIDVVLHADDSVEVRDTRPRHPRRHRAQDRPDRRRGRLHQAARRRQVRRRLVRGVRRPARRRRLGRQRAVRAPRRRGRPRRQDLRHVVPPRRARHFADAGERRRPTRRSRRSISAASCAWSARSSGASPAPASATGPTGRSSPAARRFQTDELVGRARQTAFLVPGLAIGITDERRPRARRRARDVPLRRRHRRVRRLPRPRRAASPTPGASRARARSPRPCPCSTDGGAWCPPRSQRECEVDIALRWGNGLRDRRSAASSTSSRRPKGGTHQAGFEAGLLKFLRAAGRGQRPAAEGRHRQAREGRRARRASPPC